MASTFKLDGGAADYLTWLGRSIHECGMPGNLRVRVAAGCLAIAQDHPNYEPDEIQEVLSFAETFGAWQSGCCISRE